MKQKHIDFIIRFHKPTSRHLYTLRDGGIRKGFSVDQDQSEKNLFQLALIKIYKSYT